MASRLLHRCNRQVAADSLFTRCESTTAMPALTYAEDVASARSGVGDTQVVASAAGARQPFGWISGRALHALLPCSAERRSLVFGGPAFWSVPNKTAP